MSIYNKRGTNKLPNQGPSGSFKSTAKHGHSLPYLREDMLRYGLADPDVVVSMEKDVALLRLLAMNANPPDGWTGHEYQLVYNTLNQYVLQGGHPRGAHAPTSGYGVGYIVKTVPPAFAIVEFGIDGMPLRATVRPGWRAAE